MQANDGAMSSMSVHTRWKLIWDCEMAGTWLACNLYEGLTTLRVDW